MSHISTFEVIIFNSNGVCEPGDKLKGEVILENLRPLKVKEIRLESIGLAHVNWVDSRNTEGVVETESADEQYYSCTKILYPLFEGFSADEETPRSNTTNHFRWLQPGYHSFPFEFPVPPKLPCSFEGPHGYVRYWLKAIIEKPWNLKVNTRPFTVTSKLDLNNLPHCNEEVVKSERIKLFSLLHPTGSCFASLHVNKMGYVQGEEIPINVFIKNESKGTLRSATISLEMILHYETPTQSRHTKVKLAVSKLGKINADSTVDIFDNSLKVPEGLPPNLKGCGLINMQYAVILKIKPSLFSVTCLRIPIEIIIGTIPIRLPDRSSLPPPSYIEVMEADALPNYDQVLAQQQPCL